MAVRDRLYIAGVWVVPSRPDTISVVDPTTEEVIGSVPAGTAEDVAAAVCCGSERPGELGDHFAGREGELHDTHRRVSRFEDA